MQKQWFKAKIENATFQHGTKVSRNFFERDRNRVTYSNAFRRLAGKTQIFISGYNDNLRNRLTHTIEVNTIAQIIGKEYKLDTNLIEAIALGHDIGHTPFGHMGENTLNYILNGCDLINNCNRNIPKGYRGYKHNFQGVRILAYLGVEDEAYLGFNITDFTLWGILNHTSTNCNKCNFLNQNDSTCNKYYQGLRCNNNGELKFDFYNKLNDQVIFSKSWTLEALVVQIADEISQRFHDIEDAIKANLLSIDDLLSEFHDIFYKYLKSRYRTRFNRLNKTSDKLFIPGFRHFFLNLLADEISYGTKPKLERISQEYSIASAKDFSQQKESIAKNENIIQSIVNYRDEFKELEKQFHEFLKQKVLKSYLTQSMDNKGDFIIKRLFEAYIAYPEQLPDYTIKSFFRNLVDNEANSSKFKSDTEYQGWSNCKLREKIKNRLIEDRSEVTIAILLRTIADHVSAMTDAYAIKQYESLYGIESLN